ncbi:hypothetical protein B7463_g1509, partial [Scytalidium lignicola]
MALPMITALTDCSNFSITVLPYIPQLYDLPPKLLQSQSNAAELYDIYLNTNPLVTAVAFSLFLAPIFLVVSEINRNYSQVDRCWGILPTIYNAHYAAYAHLTGLPTQRLDTLVAFSALRLTFNYWRKGGYSIGSEDYRWKIVQSKISPALFFILNVVFISFFQSVLLCLLAAPTYIILLASRFQESMSMSTPDILFFSTLMGLVLVEYFADQQQWNFQTAKAAYHKTAKRNKFDPEDLDRGFLVSGLWSWSRHPNFAAEQTIWLVLYQWTCSVTAQKYPDYKEYQKRVGKFVPNLIRGLPGDFSDQKFKPTVEQKTRRVATPNFFQHGSKYNWINIKMEAEKYSSESEDSPPAANPDKVQNRLAVRFDEQAIVNSKSTTTKTQRILPINLAPLRPSLTRYVTSSGHPLEPMSRDYPKPTAEPHIAELLTRPPLKGTFSYNLQSSKNHYLEGDTAKETRDPDGLERAKKHWLRIAEELKKQRR